jgi:hypothetical protein
MEAYLKVTGKGKTIEINEKHILDIAYSVSTPNDSNARSTDVTYKLLVTGRIIPEIGGSSGEKIVDLDLWSRVQHGTDLYRDVEAGYTAEGFTVRKYHFNKGFVQDYREDFDDQNGTGKFYIEICQKKDHNKDVTVEGNFLNE